MYSFWIIAKKDTIFGKTYKFQNFTFETSETFWITNVQIQFIPFNHSQSKEKIFEIVMLHFKMRQLTIIFCSIGSFGCWNNLKYIYIYNLHFFEQNIYSHQVLIHLNVPGIPVRKPLQNEQIDSWRTTGCVSFRGDLCKLVDWETFINEQKG